MEWLSLTSRMERFCTMTLLSNIITENRPSAPKGIIYGSPGVGKSTFGASATSSLIIDCENGVSAIRCQRTPYLATWPEILAWLQTIETEEHPYRTVVVDTCDGSRGEYHRRGRQRNVDRRRECLRCRQQPLEKLRLSDLASDFRSDRQPRYRGDPPGPCGSAGDHRHRRDHDRKNLARHS